MSGHLSYSTCQIIIKVPSSEQLIPGEFQGCSLPAEFPPFGLLQGLCWASLVLSGKESAYQAGDVGSIPGSERSPGEGNENPLQYCGLGNPMDRRAWLQSVVLHKSWARLSDL